MPKQIDNYVLNRKIGAGQYGEVFKGYDRATNKDIAVKSIKRDNVKGKFKELLESEIKVLKACQSPNIIKLYDMKKTSNNFYLIMEFCNDGDMDTYLKKRKYLTEDEAVEVLCELINGFKHLYKHNILHRDLKLANILRHDGVIKIADFGFSKILGEECLAQTMLGSPLNMAPEVLQNMEYSNKADIYSLGVCYYWMLFGRPPYNAKNINELKSMIVREDYDFPRQINAISEMSKQLIRAMLKANPKARISWEELFKHDINDFLEKKVEKELVLTLTMDGSISDNVCKLYLSQNLVIIHPSDFKKREEAVNIAVNMVRDGKRRELPGELRKKEIKEYSSNDNIKRKEPANNDKIDEGITEDEAITNDIYNNTFYLLNERNKIVFLLSVMNELRARKERKAQGQILMHLLKLTKQNYLKLSQCITERKNTFSLRSWEHFVNSPSFANLQHFLVKEETIVRHEIENNQKLVQAGPETLSFLLKVYSESAMAAIKKDELDEKNRTEWIHLSHLLDILALDKLMTQDFDFKHYYCEYGKYEMKELAEKVRGRLNLL